jgi:hypothetical protein
MTGDALLGAEAVPVALESEEKSADGAAPKSGVAIAPGGWTPSGGVSSPGGCEGAICSDCP